MLSLAPVACKPVSCHCDVRAATTLFDLAVLASALWHIGDPFSLQEMNH